MALPFIKDTLSVTVMMKISQIDKFAHTLYTEVARHYSKLFVI